MKHNDIYGQGDATYRAVGEEAGLRKLVDLFYSLMSSDPEYQTIRSWHPDDVTVSADKLVLFLCVWSGGPRTFREKYGAINIIKAHQHLRVTAAERDQWLNCMSDALTQFNCPKELKEYLMQQLWLPAERIRQITSQSE